MKKLFVVYGNCQADGLVHFLKKTPLANDFDFAIWHNWQIIMREQPLAGLLADLPRADVLVYQPCKGYLCTDGVQVPGTDALIAKELRPGAKVLSMAYLYNEGFFPIIKVGDDLNGYITSKSVKALAARGMATADLLAMDGILDYDCARRFAECLAEQSRREETTDIKMVPFILAHFQKQRLFLTQNHPTSALYAELAKQVAGLINLDLAWADIPISSENEVGMNGTLPIHPAVVAELALQYPPDTDLSYYRTLLAELVTKSQ